MFLSQQVFILNFLSSIVFLSTFCSRLYRDNNNRWIIIKSHLSLDSEKIVPLDKLAVVATVATFVENEKIIAFFRFFDDEDDSGHKTQLWKHENVFIVA